MPLYDAVVHTFGTVATGGFSSKTASVGFYDSLAIEAIIAFFMTASGVSFSLYYLLYTRRRYDVVLDQELLAYLGIIAASAFLVWGVLAFEGDYRDEMGRALRDSAFTVSSIITTTGYVTADLVRLAALGLFAAWVAIFGAATFLVVLQENLNLTSSATAVAATLNDVGPGLDQVGATESFEIVNPFGRVVLTLCMLLGRLAVFTVLALLSPAFWRR
jgi:Trk-type K+ transport system membrane component